MATAIDTPQSPGSHLMPALDRATVADAMHPGILSCEPEMSLSAVARMMASHHVHCLVVLCVTGEEDGDSLVWRILCDLDLLHGAMLEGGGQTSDALARQAVHTVDPTLPLRAAGGLMLKLGASHVLVVDPLGSVRSACSPRLTSRAFLRGAWHSRAGGAETVSHEPL